MKTEDFPVYFGIKKDGVLLDGYKTAEKKPLKRKKKKLHKEVITMLIKLLIIFVILVTALLLLCIWVLSESAGSRIRREAKKPDCYKSNNSPYPLCKGNGSEDCQYCCLYDSLYIEDD